MFGLIFHKLVDLSEKVTLTADPPLFSSRCRLQSAVKLDARAQRTDHRRVIRCTAPTGTSAEITATVTNFFRQVFTHALTRGPTVLRMVHWSIYNEKGRRELALVTQWMEGPLPQASRLDPTQKMIVLYGIALGMSHLHSLHVIHRALRPSNILVDARHYPRIAHLRLAKTTAGGVDQSQLLGSDSYNAPEARVVDDDQPIRYTFSADLYSYGSTFYQIVTGREPPENAPGGVRLENAKHARLLERLWSARPENRPSCSVIARKLLKPSYWLRGTNRELFREYLEWVGTANSVMQGKRLDLRAPWLKAVHDEGREIDADMREKLFARCDYGDAEVQIATGLLTLMGHMGSLNLLDGARRLNEHLHILWVKFLIKCFSCGRPLQRGVVFEIGSRLAEAVAEYRRGALDADEEAMLRFGSYLLVYGCENAGIWILRLLGDNGSLRANFTLGDWFYRWKNDLESALKCFKSCVNDTVCDFAEPYLVGMSIALELKDYGQASEIGKQLGDSGIHLDSDQVGKYRLMKNVLADATRKPCRLPPALARAQGAKRVTIGGR
jgi:hypothetical protein